MLKQLTPWILISLTATACISEKPDDEDQENEDTGTPPPPPPAGLNVDAMAFLARTAFVNDATDGPRVDSDAGGTPYVTIDGTTDSIISVFLFDTTASDYCAVDWEFTAANVTKDDNYDD